MPHGELGDGESEAVPEPEGLGDGDGVAVVEGLGEELAETLGEAVGDGTKREMMRTVPAPRSAITWTSAPREGTMKPDPGDL